MLHFSFELLYFISLLNKALMDKSFRGVTKKILKNSSATPKPARFQRFFRYNN